MAALRRVTLKRDNVKRQMISFIEFVDSCTPQNSAQLPVRISRAKEIYEKYDEAQFEVETQSRELLEAEEDRPTEQQILALETELTIERNTFENAYFEALTKAQETIRNQEATAEQPRRQQENANFRNKLHVKLPVLELPKFDGSYNKWLHFRDTFTTVIHTRDELTFVQKFQYLRSALSDEALQSIEALETTDANYEVAWNLLKDRYENKKLIVNTHLKELFDLPQINKVTNHSVLRRFIDTVRTHLRALESLGEPIEHWDTILIYMISNKLEYVTRRDWEIHVGKEDFANNPKMDDLFDFLTRRSHTLELVEGSKSKQEQVKASNAPKKFEKKVSLATTNSPVCPYCQEGHHIYHCESFLKLSATEKRQEVKKRQLCCNCLKKGHYAQVCRSSSCTKCSEKHNTLLHNDNTEKTTTKNDTKAVLTSNCVVETNRENAIIDQTMNNDENNEQNQEEISVVNYATRQENTQVVLATALIQIIGVDGKPIQCRALLDNASQSNMITKDLVQKLGFRPKKVNVPLSGVCQSRSNVKESIGVSIKSMQNDFSTRLECLVAPVITEQLPQTRIDPTTLNIPSKRKLADPNYYIPGSIDVLIGGGIFWKLLAGVQKLLGKNKPMLIKTLLGWVVGGFLTDSEVPSSLPRCQMLTTKSLNDQIEKFWKIEEQQTKKFYTPEEQYCEEYLKKTTFRQHDGRFVVRLPKNPSVVLGNSEDSALRRLYASERRMNRDENLKKSSIEFMNDYQTMGHMTKVSRKTNSDPNENFYLPYQPVIRTTSLTTKFRMVFDGSAKSDSRVSLNEKLLPGPNLQEDLIDIVLRFRTHQYVITADIAMMFRQILVHPDDRKLQQILWREDPNKAVETFILNTVTYGTCCAPFLAIRCLKQLAEEKEGKVYPMAAKALRSDFYMDDVLTGSHTLEKTTKLQQQLQELLAKGQFPLRKWRANDTRILKHLIEDRKADNLLVLDKQEPLSTLGLLWDSSSDTLQYSVNIQDVCKPTKRNILSQIAKIYDPLGLIGPVMINAKIIMQELWKLQLTWDETVPQSTFSRWQNYYTSLPKINDLRITRNVNTGNISENFEIHGFGDASEKAYGACLYCVYKTNDGTTKSFLLCSKTRVAPIKTISLPKLELCASLLLAKLTDSVTKALQGKVTNVYLWSDSTIVLCWIKSSPHQLKTFFANRVAEIQALTSKAEWNHVPSEENPADMLSRGLTVETFLENELWWHGPTWIQSKKEWPFQTISRPNEDPGRKPEVMLTTALTYNFTIIQKYSNFRKLQRIFGYCARFIENAQGGHKQGNLTPDELDKATTLILRIVQRETFALELKNLKTSETVNYKSPLRQLNPFIDMDGLIRVGGRLRHAEISENEKHPIVLPSKHHITTLILRGEHLKLLHCGPQHLLSSIRTRYWPLSGRREARKITQRCVSCFRYKPRTLDTVMADLPADRVTESIRPFDVCGVDYAGPFVIRESKRRGNIPTSKAYIAVFTCFKTKAVHLELVSSLTTETFLAALRRFSSRRGTCSHMYSDNGSNFIGAARELKEIYEFLEKEKTNITSELSVQHITWHFIPPRAPHFGGLWEAAVKSVKKHLMITMKNLLYTFEEYYTLLSEIEAVLNSRPLTPLSSDPNDFSALTPSHFLTGDSLLQPAQKNYVNVADNHLNRLEHLQKLKQEYWKRWHRDYLQQLQIRSKWAKGAQNLEIGTLVLLMEDNLPPLQWKLGRVIEVHPGEDRIVRVATVKTSSAIFKRAVKKLCALPHES